MANLHPVFAMDKEDSAFSQAVSQEKHERIARESLRDFVVFSNALEQELQRLKEKASQGLAIDNDLLEKMTIVKEKYATVMTGFMELDAPNQRLTLIIFADAVQDLMKYIHKRKEH